MSLPLATQPLATDEIAETAAWLASMQLADGMLPWYRGGHADPWNHVEAVMALAAGGRWAEVDRAFGWLAKQQLPDGSWCTFYLPYGVLEPRRDPNVCAYVATGAWWCYRLGAGKGLLEDLWPLIDRALEWCLLRQLPGGEMVWSVAPDQTEGSFALLSATSSLQHSLRCGALVAAALGHDRPQWAAAADRAARAVAERPGSFAPKRRWAMDWYYPVLTGALDGEGARARVTERWREFVEEGLGARCVSDRFWVTAAETAECAMAAARAGLGEQAGLLLGWTRHLRAPGGGYWTGCAHPQCVRYPGGQQSTYSAAAVLIADHVLCGRSPAATLFGGRRGTPPSAGSRRMDQVHEP